MTDLDSMIAILVAIGTISLAIMSYISINYSRKLNEKLLRKEELRDRPLFEISSMGVCKPIHMLEVSHPHSFNVTLKNIGGVSARLERLIILHKEDEHGNPGTLHRMKYIFPSGSIKKFNILMRGIPNSEEILISITYTCGDANFDAIESEIVESDEDFELCEEDIEDYEDLEEIEECVGLAEYSQEFLFRLKSRNSDDGDTYLVEKSAPTENIYLEEECLGYTPAD